VRTRATSTSSLTTPPSYDAEASAVLTRRVARTALGGPGHRVLGWLVLRSVAGAPARAAGRLLQTPLLSGTESRWSFLGS